MIIFFSYPHDSNAEFVLRLKGDLVKKGHKVLLDVYEVNEGDDWRRKLTTGILDSDAVVAFLSEHAMREDSVCLNEIAIAIAEKGDDAVVRVLLEPEKTVNAPVSVTHIQWLRMDEHLSQSTDDGWYRTRFEKLVDLIERPDSATRNGELDTLRKVLDPLSFNAEIAYHLPRFTGRQWLVSRYKDWLAKPLSSSYKSNVFRIEGGPGMGKTAIASYLTHATQGSVIGVHLCKYGEGATHDPVRMVLSLAYQMASRLPDYRARLLRVPRIQSCIPRQLDMENVKAIDLTDKDDAGSLWSMLIKEPLGGKSGLIDRQRLAIVIDGLDEATKNGQNEIVNLLTRTIKLLPTWVGLVLLGRPDPELTARLDEYTAQVIKGDDAANLEDLRNYIDVWLDVEVHAGRLPAHQVTAAAIALLEKSEGAFLYLVSAREEALDLCNPAALPMGLNLLYMEAFERRFPDVIIDPDNPATRWNALVKPLLGYILASPEPLPLDLARQLMGWDTDATGNEKLHKTLLALGSLIKRNGNPDKPETCTLAPFHNSVREWLTSETSQQFRVFTEASIYPLSEVTWKRYLHNKENDAYAWQVLPDFLAKLSQDKQDDLLGAPNWDTSQVLFRLAESMTPKQRYAEAQSSWVAQVRFSERLCQSAPENAEFANYLASSLAQLGDTFTTLGHNNEALGHYQRGLKISEELSSRAPENTEFARDLSVTLNRLGDTLASLERPSEEVLGHYMRSLKIVLGLSEREPKNTELARDLSFSFDRLGDALLGLKYKDEALVYYKRSLMISQDLSALDPESTLFARDLSFSFDRLGDTLVRLERPDEALGYYQQSLKIRENLSVRDPENVQFAHDLSASFSWIGDTLDMLQRPDEALGYYHRSLYICENLRARAPENALFALDLVDVNFGRIGHTLLVSLKRPDEAMGYYMRGLELAEDLSERAPENAQFAGDLLLRFGRFGDILVSLERTVEALDYYQKGLKIAEHLSERDPENTEFASDLAVSFQRLGDALVSLERLDEALGYFQRGLKIQEDLSARASDNAKFARSMSITFNRLGDTLAGLERPNEALGYYQRSLKIREDLSVRNPDNAEFARDLWVSYWKSACLTNGEEQVVLWRKVYAVLMSMQDLGILANDDEQYVVAVKAQLNLE